MKGMLTPELTSPPPQLGSTPLSGSLAGPTHSDVIWATSCREVKPAVRKLSRYWLIFTALSQSSTEVKAVKSGMERSRRG